MTVVTVLLAILLLSFIIIIHELGHYCVGRLCRVGIEEFSVGFGPKLLQWKRRGIAYSVRLILLGGYVRFAGEDADDDDPAAFNNQAIWKRFLTILAGPVMNFVLAFVVTLGLLMGYGLYQTTPVVNSVIDGTPAAESGLQAGDVITAVNGTAITRDQEGYAAMTQIVGALEAGDELHLTVQRGEETVEIDTGLYTDETGAPKMGIYVSQERIPMTLWDGVRYSGQVLVNLTREMLDSLRKLIFKGEGLDQMSGTVGIVSVASQAIRLGFDRVLYLVLIISMNLGILNLLPLPALDGGRLVFLIIEAIRRLFGRGPIPRDKEGLVHLIGLGAFFILFIVLTWHDIATLIRR